MYLSIIYPSHWFHFYGKLLLIIQFMTSFQVTAPTTLPTTHEKGGIISHDNSLPGIS